MTLGKKIKQFFYHKIGQKVKRPQITALDITETAIKDLTPIASLMTIGADADSSIVERMIHGPYEVTTSLYAIASAYVNDVGIRTGTAGILKEVGEIAGNSIESLYDHPLETAAGVAITYIGGKLLAKGIKKYDHKLRDKLATKDGYEPETR